MSANVRTVAMIVAALLANACSQSQRSDQKVENDADVLAKVGNMVVTKQDIENELSLMPARWRAQAKTPGGMRNIVQNIVKRRLVLQEAEARGLDKDPQLLVELERLKTSRLLNKMIETNKAEEEVLLRQRFEQNRDAFRIPDRVKARHILLKVPADAPKAKVAEIQRKAQRIAREARSGKDFAALARKYSEGPTRDKGGDLGVFQRGRMDPAFENAVFSMKKGEISDPVRTAFGFHIIKLEDRIPGKEPTFEEVKDQVAKRFRAQIQREKYEKLMSELEKKYPVEYYIESEKRPAAARPATGG